ncbi:MAG: hypothetical protein JNJ48_08745 [Phycisphaerae bacterium]|nr:hypothetical protein [Phycisphaerae bacterium]
MNRARVACLSLLPLCLLAACAQDNLKAQRKDILNDPTPELDTHRERWSDRQNAYHNTVDTNLRTLNSDLGRIMLFDRPSRLSPEPIR